MYVKRDSRDWTKKHIDCNWSFCFLCVKEKSPIKLSLASLSLKLMPPQKDASSFAGVLFLLLLFVQVQRRNSAWLFENEFKIWMNTVFPELCSTTLSNCLKKLVKMKKWKSPALRASVCMLCTMLSWFNCLCNKWWLMESGLFFLPWACRSLYPSRCLLCHCHQQKRKTWTTSRYLRLRAPENSEQHLTRDGSLL